MNIEELDEQIKIQEAEIEKIEADIKSLEEAYNNKELTEEEYQKYKDQNDEIIEQVKKKISNLKGRKTKAINKQESEERVEIVFNNYLKNKKERLDNVLIGLDQELLDNIEEIKLEREKTKDLGLEDIDSSKNIDIELLERIVNEHNEEDIDKVLEDINNGNVTGIERMKFEKVLNKIKKTLPQIKDVEEKLNDDNNTVVPEEVVNNENIPVTEENSILKQDAITDNERIEYLKNEIDNIQREIKEFPSDGDIHEYDRMNAQILDYQKELADLENKYDQSTVINEEESVVENDEISTLEAEIAALSEKVHTRDVERFVNGNKESDINVDEILSEIAEKQKQIEEIKKYNDIANDSQQELEENAEYKNQINIYKAKLGFVDSIINGKIIENQTPQVHEFIKNISQANEIFSIDRRLYNTEDDYNEEEYAQIVDKNGKLEKILADKDKINLDEPIVAYNWIKKLTPYINIHALNGNLDQPLDEYVLDVLRSYDYGVEESKIVDKNSFYDNLVALKMQELEKYHFIATSYESSHVDNINLSSDMIKDVSKLNYYKKIEKRLLSNINKYNKTLKELNSDREDILAEYNEKFDIINTEYTKQYVENFEEENTVAELNLVSKQFVTEANDVNLAYDKFKNDLTVENAKVLFDYISRLHEPALRREAKDKAYRLYEKANFNEQDKNTISAYVNTKGIRLEKLKEKAELDDKLNSERKEKLELAIQELTQEKDELINNLEISIAEVNNKRETNNNLLEALRAEMTPVRDRLSERGYIEPITENEIEIEEPKKEKTSFFTKIKNFFSKKPKEEEEDFDLTPVTEENEELAEFVPIRKIKKIKETLYEKIKNNKFKDAIKKAFSYMKEYTVPTVILVGSVLLGLTTQGIINQANKIAANNKDDGKKIEQDSEVNDNELNDVLDKNGASLEESENILAQEPVEIVEETNQIEKAAEIEELTANQKVDNLRSANVAALDRVRDRSNPEKAYISVDRATNDQDGYTSEQLITSSWEHAEVSAYFIMDDGGIHQLEEESAAEMFADGEQNIIAMVTNEDTNGNKVPIGFIRLSPLEKDMEMGRSK